MNKTIHYIWLGGKKKTRVIRKCIATWKKNMPDWQIKEWNESNFDLDKYEYCREAYDAKKYAFAADVIRFDVLYRYGGLYFDTDVKLLKDFAPLTERYHAFCGFEFKMVAPGLVLFSSEPGNAIFRDILDVYENTHFIVNGEPNTKVVGEYFSEVLEKYGFVYENKEQDCAGFAVLPSTYFCPSDGYGNPLDFSENTYSVHLFAGSWLPLKRRFVTRVKRICYRIFGRERIQRLLHGKK